MSFAAKRGISQALQMRKKVTVVPEPSQAPIESPAVEEIPLDVEQENSQSEAIQQDSPAVIYSFL